MLCFFVTESGEVRGVGRPGNYDAPPKTQGQLVAKWRMKGGRDRFQVVNLDEVVRSRIFAVQLPNVGYKNFFNAKVGNMYSWTTHDQQVERSHLSEEEALVFTHRQDPEGDTAITTNWPATFLERDWRPR